MAVVKIKFLDPTQMISREDAYEKGIKLVQLLSAVYTPMTEEEHERIQQHRTDTLPLLQKHITKI